jgi:hypothetical protein
MDNTPRNNNHSPDVRYLKLLVDGSIHNSAPSHHYRVPNHNTSHRLVVADNDGLAAGVDDLVEDNLEEVDAVADGLEVVAVSPVVVV